MITRREKYQTDQTNHRTIITRRKMKLAKRTAIALGINGGINVILAQINAYHHHDTRAMIYHITGMIILFAAFYFLGQCHHHRRQLQIDEVLGPDHRN